MNEIIQFYIENFFVKWIFFHFHQFFFQLSFGCSSPTKSYQQESRRSQKSSNIPNVF